MSDADAALLVVDEVSRTNTDLSVVRKPFERYSSSGEINTHVHDTQQVIERVAEAFVRSFARGGDIGQADRQRHAAGAASAPASARLRAGAAQILRRRRAADVGPVDAGFAARGHIKRAARRR